MNELLSICHVIVVLATDFFFQFSRFSIKSSHLLDVKNPSLDLKLGAVAYGAKVTPWRRGLRSNWRGRRCGADIARGQRHESIKIHACICALGCMQQRRLAKILRKFIQVREPVPTTVVMMLHYDAWQFGRSMSTNYNRYESFYQKISTTMNPSKFRQFQARQRNIVHD